MLQADPQWAADAVYREWNHLDLVVDLAGYRSVIIENKVFSLPDEDQLDGYTAVNIPAIGRDGANKVLLSLSDPGWPNGRYEGWTWLLSYATLAERVLPSVQRYLAKDP